jgi:uncharacterized protein (TIGR02391 family)
LHGARRFRSEEDFQNFVAARRLQKDVLHPKISNVVWQEFIRGQYDVAVFQAMKAVEVSVREASNLSAKDISTNLMRKAFDPETGPLTDRTAEKAEREARSTLFAGAIGSYKNPHSHRDVPIDGPDEAMEIVLSRAISCVLSMLALPRCPIRHLNPRRNASALVHLYARSFIGQILDRYARVLSNYLISLALPRGLEPLFSP